MTSEPRTAASRPSRLDCAPPQRPSASQRPIAGASRLRAAQPPVESRPSRNKPPVDEFKFSTGKPDLPSLDFEYKPPSFSKTESPIEESKPSSTFEPEEKEEAWSTSNTDDSPTISPILKSDGSVGLGVGGVSFNSDGTIGFRLGSGLTFNSDGTVGWSLW